MHSLQRPQLCTRMSTATHNRRQQMKLNTATAFKPQALAEHEHHALQLAVVEEEGERPQRAVLREGLAVGIGIVAVQLALVGLDLRDDRLPQHRCKQAILLAQDHGQVALSSDERHHHTTRAHTVDGSHNELKVGLACKLA
jgi:hypothetical protein